MPLSTRKYENAAVLPLRLLGLENLKILRERGRCGGGGGWSGVRGVEKMETINSLGANSIKGEKTGEK